MTLTQLELEKALNDAGVRFGIKEDKGHVHIYVSGTNEKVDKVLEFVEANRILGINMTVYHVEDHDTRLRPIEEG